MISSRNNPKVKEWLSLTKKSQRDLTHKALIESEHLIEEAINNNLLELLIISDQYEGSITHPNYEVVSKGVAEKLSQTKSTSDIFGIIRIPQENLTGTKWLFLDTVQDPGNVGTLIRSAKSFGFDGIITNSGCADVYSDKVLRASQGAVFSIPCVRMELQDVLLIKENKQLLSTYLHTDAQYTMPKDNFILCLGSEGQGLNPQYESVMDINVGVKTQAFESLNVAIAGSILMYMSQN